MLNEFIVLLVYIFLDAFSMVEQLTPKNVENSNQVERCENYCRMRVLIRTFKHPLVSRSCLQQPGHLYWLFVAWEGRRGAVVVKMRDSLAPCPAVSTPGADCFRTASGRIEERLPGPAADRPGA